MPDYPIVKIPQRFRQINKAIPALPPEPIAPSEPIKPVEPRAPELLVVKENFVSSGCLSSVLIWLFGIIIILVGNMGGSFPVATGIEAIFMLFGYFRPRNTDSKRAEKNNSEKRGIYAKAFEKYNEDKIIFEKKNLIYIRVTIA